MARLRAPTAELRDWAGRATTRRRTAERPSAPAGRSRGGSASGGAPTRAALGSPEAGLLHGPEPDPPPAPRRPLSSHPVPTEPRPSE